MNNLNLFRNSVIVLVLLISFAVKAQTCVYDGKTYSKGSVICIDGYEYQCDGESWNYLGISCGTAIHRSDDKISSEAMSILSKNTSKIKSISFDTKVLSPCITMYHVSMSKVGLRNNCSKCATAVINWSSVGLKYYEVAAYGNREIEIESSYGQIIGENPCK